ncbi:alpha-amylase family glycosyl hydrolase [Thiofilum flexile]|uniref:alpha-amylase family glycosyl hydrolase n=1 Tax=Thiofilum flexile TaxID=125627 RepID=UPI000364C826|nr:alpha-amylase family glycosyl hydrolase [Thiofilum flexile]
MQSWWRGGVTYQIYPRSYQDSNNDGIGDLKGITERLSYIADLGVDSIWLSPIFPSPMLDMGYDVSNYTDINPEFGTLADFDALIARAHELGLKVIIDQVISHTSDQHPFFIESRQNRTNPKADWYVWADPKHDGSPPNNWLAIFGGGAWQWDARRHQYYLHNFLVEQPDLNFHNPEVQDWLLSTMRFWLERGVDGFRLDTVNFYFHDALLRNDPADYRKKDKPEWNPYAMQYHIFSKNQPENLAFIERLRALLDEFDDRAVVGEMGESHHAIKMMGEYTTGKRLHMCYSFEMLSDPFGAAHFRKQVEEFFTDAPKGWPCWAFSNHDVVRHVSRWAEHGVSREALAKQMAALLLSLEGSVCLYQGEELGQTETDLEYNELIDPQGLRFWPENKGRDGCRTPMTWDASVPNAGFTQGKPWLPIKAAQIANNAAAQLDKADSVLSFYKQMLRVRRQFESLRTGDTKFFATSEPILAFSRENKVVCIFNLSPEPHQVAVQGVGEVIVAEGANLVSGQLQLAGNGFALFHDQGVVINGKSE